jgi:hypothetical protein
MKRGLIAKALFMIGIIIISIFTISNFNLVKAEESNLCCEKTKGGDSCVYTAGESCDSDYLTAPTSCEQTSYCKPGCCVSDLGVCSKSVGQATCESIDGYSWYEGAACEIDACQKECCVVGEAQCFLSTEAYCKNTISGFEDLELDWRDVDSENECVNICEASNKGCCVSPDACVYGAKGMCEYDGVDLIEGVGFYDDTYCSDVGICGCVNNKDDVRCINEDAYYFDSCGNQDSIADDCDYASGKWCGTKPDGTVGCVETGCDNTFNGIYSVNNVVENRDVHDSNIGNPRQNGESWCLYESPAGAFKDFPGSQHYRAYCYFGEEIVEPCKDYREEVCVQMPYLNYFYLDDYGISWLQGKYDGSYDGLTGSACIDNTDNALFFSNITTVSVGNNWDDSSLIDTCSAANLDCKMTYARTDRADNTFEPGVGVMCTSPQWAKVMNEYCRSMGDCGASSNLVGEFSSVGFAMVPSQEYLAPKDDPSRNKVFVGYDTCVDHFIDGEKYGGESHAKLDDFLDQYNKVNNYEQEAIFCLYDCNEKEGFEECDFIETVDKEMYKLYSSLEYYHRIGAMEEDGKKVIYNVKSPENDIDLPNFEKEFRYESYGVYGGLVGISQMVGGIEFGDIPSGIASIYALGIINTVGSQAFALGGTLVAYSLLEVSEETGKKILQWGVAASDKTIISMSSIIAGAVTIAMEIVGWIEISKTDDPIERMDRAQAFAITSGVAAGVTAVSLYLAAATSSLGPVGWVVSIVAIVVAGVSAILASGGETKEVTITSQCMPWQPPSGGEYCTLCDIPVSNGGLALDNGEKILRGYECTEYKCKSLGMACQFISENQGTDRPKCIASETNDVNHPIIKGGLLLGDYANLEFDFVKDQYLIVNEKVQPYTFFEFQIETDEPSQCKIEEATQDNSFTSEDYDSMEMFFPDSYFDYIHNQSWILMPETKYSFYIRCTDINGIAHEAPFVVQVETDAGADLTPPSIEATSIVNGGYVSAEASSTPLTIYTNEPVEDCRWSNLDTEYSLMENYFLCSGVPSSASPYFENECTTLLNVTEGTNGYYIACMDGAGNANTENYYFSLQSTVSLNLDYVSPNGETIYLDSVTMQAQTSAGAENGKAVCSYNGIEFFETNSAVHKQVLENLVAGSYSYNINCVDAAGNINQSVISFNIEVDIDEPEIVNLYRTESTVYYTLDEDAECEVYFEDFEFGSGTDVTGNSFTLTGVDEYYLKCQDIFGNIGEWTVNV